MKIKFRSSWDDTISWAEREYGNWGRVAALALRASQASSKRLQAKYLVQAGYDVSALLRELGLPYSNLGLAEAARQVFERACADWAKR